MNNVNGDSTSLFQNLLTIFVFVYFTSKIAFIGTMDTMPLKTNEQELISIIGGVVCFILIYVFTNLSNRNLLIPSKSNNIYMLISYVVSFLVVRFLVGRRETQGMTLDETNDGFNQNPVLMGSVLCLIAGMVIINMFFGSGNSNSSRGYISYFFFVSIAFITIYVLMKSNQKNTVQNLSLTSVVLFACFLITADIETNFIGMNSIQIFMMILFTMLVSKFGLHSLVYKNPLSETTETSSSDNQINISPSFLILITIMSVVFFYFTSKDE